MACIRFAVLLYCSYSSWLLLCMCLLYCLLSWLAACIACLAWLAVGWMDDSYCFALPVNVEWCWSIILMVFNASCKSMNSQAVKFTEFFNNLVGRMTKSTFEPLVVIYDQHGRPSLITIIKFCLNCRNLERHDCHYRMK